MISDNNINYDHLILKGGALSQTEKNIVKKLKDVSYEEAKEDLEKLKNIQCNKINVKSLIGNNYIFYFFYDKLIKTKTKKGFDYFMARKQIIKDKLNKKKTFLNFYNYYKRNNPNYPLERIYFRYFNLYYS
jgi:hypothetical protein